MTEALVEKLNLKTRLGYGIGDIAICLYWSGVGLYLLYFYTDVVGISPSLAGLIYGIGMFWDAITDPFMGVEFSSKYDKIKYWVPVEQGSKFNE